MCPSCGAALQLLSGRDGWPVVPAMADGGRVVERRVLANVYACPRCEFVQTGPAGLAGDTWAAWCRRLEVSGVARAVASLSAADDLAFYCRRYGRARSAAELNRGRS